MAEAHSAVAFSFRVTQEGFDVDLNHEALKAVWWSGLLSWKKRIGRFKNNFKTAIYPGSFFSLLTIMPLTMALKFGGVDVSFGLINKLQIHMPWSTGNSGLAKLLACGMFSGIAWSALIFIQKCTLQQLLSYHQWIYELQGPKSLKTKIWMISVKIFGGGKPLLNSYQSCLPKLPVPSVKLTIHRYLRSVRPLMTDKKYKEMERLSEDFEKNMGKKLQRYLILKSYWAINYVSDWWEEYVYLRGRSPIMVNSNFYGVDAVFAKTTSVQAARAANLVYAMLQYRRSVERQELEPIILNKTVPLCSAQYERQFNTIRIPGLETDTLVHYQNSNHIVVYHRGRYFKLYIRNRGNLLKPCELEVSFQKILDDASQPCDGEEHLAALTAGDRVPWAKARKEFFSSGKNKISLSAIDKAAFCVSLDDEPQTFDPADPSKLNKFCSSMLHGKGYDRWFDKSFTLVVCSNGRVGFNAEHSWADAPIMGHLWELSSVVDRNLGYSEDGHTLGKVMTTPPNPVRLEWDLPDPCIQMIENSLQVAEQLYSDVDLSILVHGAYGKGFMKKCKISPDAYIQMALQLAYYRDAKTFCLTYESTMTRLYREGRTETVRSCSLESVNFVKAMEDRTKTNKERIELLRLAGTLHQKMYKDAMNGMGIDRHLFCLYVVSKYLGLNSPFLAEVLSNPWRLSTSQTPYQQTNKIDLKKYPDHLSAGGGFGPVADDGYGVSYIIAGENMVFFHVSSKRTFAQTDSTRFSKLIENALADMKAMFENC